VVCLAPRAQEDSVRPRRPAGASYLLIAGLFSWDVVIWSPLYFAAIAAWSLLVATGAGCLRMRQKVYSREAL
jgi:hypothetical protein